METGQQFYKCWEDFDNWKQLVPEIGLVNSFKDYKKILPQKEELFNGEDCIGLHMINHIPKLLTWVKLFSDINSQCSRGGEGC